MRRTAVRSRRHKSRDVWGGGRRRSCLRKFHGHAANLHRALLQWHIGTNSDRPAASCNLIVESREGVSDSIPIVPATPATIRPDTSDAGLSHIDAPGLLSLTFRTDPPRLVYARTSVLAESLGLPGGVYDAPVLNQSI